MDLSSNPENDIKKLKGEIINHFPKCRTFNINLNTFIPLSVIQVENELLMNKSFRHLIFYHFYNYISKNRNIPIANTKTFIDFLIDIIKIEKDIKTKEIIVNVNKLNKSENISEINKEILSIIRDLNEKFKGNELKIGVLENDDISEEEEEDDNQNFDEINAFYIIKYLYIKHKENKLMPYLSEETKDLIDYFKNDNYKYNLIDNDNNEDNNTLKIKIENYLIELCNKLNKSKIDTSKINNLIYEIINMIKFLKIYDYIFIPFLGTSNAGKTTIINGIIGKDILPTDIGECTKRGIIIRYSNMYENEITIKKANQFV